MHFWTFLGTQGTLHSKRWDQQLMREETPTGGEDGGEKLGVMEKGYRKKLGLRADFKAPGWMWMLGGREFHSFRAVTLKDLSPKLLV